MTNYKMNQMNNNDVLPRGSAASLGRLPELEHVKVRVHLRSSSGSSSNREEQGNER